MIWVKFPCLFDCDRKWDAMFIYRWVLFFSCRRIWLVAAHIDEMMKSYPYYWVIIEEWRRPETSLLFLRDMLGRYGGKLVCRSRMCRVLRMWPKSKLKIFWSGPLWCQMLAPPLALRDDWCGDSMLLHMSMFLFKITSWSHVVIWMITYLVRSLFSRIDLKNK